MNAPPVKFVKVERDCQHNKNLRASGTRHGILYDYDIVVAGKRVGCFMAHGFKRCYTLHDVDGCNVQRWEHNRSWSIDVSTKADFHLAFEKWGCLLPSDAELVAKREAREEENKRLAAEQAASRRVYRMEMSASAMFDLIVEFQDHIGDRARDIIASVNPEVSSNAE